jgi:hypothetical protein
MSSPIFMVGPPKNPWVNKKNPNPQVIKITL